MLFSRTTKIVIFALLSFLNTIPCNGFEIIIDEDFDLSLFEGTPGFCSYFKIHAILCKPRASNPGKFGFWSSCESNSCEISISVGKLGGLGLVPNKVRVNAYVEAPDAQIRIRYKRTPNSGTANMLPPIENTNSWVESPEYDLDAINPPLTPEAEIVIRLSSGPLVESRDILDRIIFTFTEDPPSTPPPEIFYIDTAEDLAFMDGTSTCTYVHQISEICKHGLIAPGGFGFWSSCTENACEIAIRLGNIGAFEMVPKKVRVLSWVEAPDAQIRLRYRRSANGGVVNLQPAIENTLGWAESNDFDLESIEPPLTPDAVLIVRLSSGPMGGSIDVLDRISFNFEDSLPNPTTQLTTEAPIITTPEIPISTPQIDTEFIIDNLSDLEAVQGSINTCAYVEPYYFLCKQGVPDPGTLGFWSSCGLSSCEVSVNLGKLSQGLGKLPNTVRALALADSQDADIRFRYKLTPNSNPVNMVPLIENTNGWRESEEYDLQDIPGLTDESEILIRLASGPSADSRDILDSITFDFTNRPPNEIIIDNALELTAVEGMPGSSSCTYSETFGSLCKSGLSNPGQIGYWSSCTTGSCEISISLGKIGGLRIVPSKVRVLVWVESPDAEVRLRYRRTPGGATVNLPNPIESTIDWVESWDFDLHQINPPLTPESEILIRLSSGPYDHSIDVLDKIIFTTSPDPPIPTMTPSSTPATDLPVIIDTLQDWVAVEGSINTCTYVVSQSELCKSGTSSTPTTGFWSSCDDNSCEISVSLGKIGGYGKVPTKVRGKVWAESPTGLVRFRYKITPISTPINIRPDIENTNSWTETDDYDLTALPNLTPDSEIVLRLQSAPLPESIDILDQIIFEFES